MYYNPKYRNRRKVWWKPGAVSFNPKKLDPVTWKVFSQDNINIQAGNSVLVALSFGVEMSEGVTVVLLDKKLQRKKCGLMNEIVMENTSDISILIQNHSNENITLSPGEDLCLLRYV